MIPEKLTLKNFMCYRENVPSLNFEGFHVACLCGDNGHGKSALLDAMTWALWGKARAKSDDALIHLGQSEMEVEFEFAVGHNRYRVLRKRTRSVLKRPGQPALNLFVAGSEGFTDISGNSIRETEQKIIDVLRMDYDTFVHSAFLLQGQADKFSTSKPAERKEVLANILGLSLYDEIEKLAKNYIKEREISFQALTGDLNRIEQELGKKHDYESDLQRVQADIGIVSASVRDRESALNALRQARKALELKEEENKQIDKRIAKAKEQLQYLDARTKEHLFRIQKYDNILSAYQANSGSIKVKLSELVGQEQVLMEKRESEKKLDGQIHLLNTTNSQLEKDGKELREKLQLLEKGDAECPLCGNKLGVEERKRIVTNYEKQIVEKRDSYRTNAGEIKRKDEELKALEQEIRRIETAITSERTRLERLAGDLERQRAEAEEMLPKEKEALGEAQKAMEGWRETLRESSEEREKLSAELLSLPGIEKDIGEVEKEHRELREREWRLIENLGKLQESLRRCRQLEEEKVTKKKELRMVVEERSIYEELALAFGKKGAQALIIEKALPEIEYEANRLLGKMTDNRMSLKIESQRDTKKGDTIETLDIKIADDLGTRDYEMFSGGEAFRVDFALRIALSRLLARRAGAPLPTLIIDEGFGTQDSTGREKLVEAINSIQDDFEKILVITHIDELKDAFPVRIDVVKTEEGSTFSFN
ncbi:MAG: SMC family ATPase [Chloroflexi bacterium]|nr:SMC family ATPase [Chloroflexota bacterium]